MAEETYHTVAREGKIALGGALRRPRAGVGVARRLPRRQGYYYAIDDACPHRGAPLCDGIVYDQSVTCTWHGWRFSLVDGRWLDNPRTRVEYPYPVRLVGDLIQVAID